ncbi:hypothetical protein MCEMSEM23_01264 [Rhabdaerophilaceae bacterium]
MRRLAVGLLLAFGHAFVAQAQTTPQPGWSLGISSGPSWTSNPRDVTARARGDWSASNEISLGHRLPLWSGGALSLNLTGTSELYARENREGRQRGLVSLGVSHNWSGTILTVSALARKSLSHDFSGHESASQEIAVAITRTFIVAGGWSLTVFARGARRLHNDGTEDQIRAGVNATLAYRTGPWTMRIGGGFSYALEDKTIFLPRINDRTVSARAGITYEWAKDRDLSLGGVFTRTYSSYEPNRTKAFSVSPRISATIRF